MALALVSTETKGMAVSTTVNWSTKFTKGIRFSGELKDPKLTFITFLFELSVKQCNFNFFLGGELMNKLGGFNKIDETSWAGSSVLANPKFIERSIVQKNRR